MSPEPSEIIDKVDGLFVRQNGGFDFAAWAHVARKVELSRARFFCLANDSVVGPLAIVSLNRVIARVRSSDAHLVGLTKSNEIIAHFQSYFLVAKGSGVQTLLDFLEMVRMLEDKWQVIFSHEIKVLEYFRKKELRTEALFPSLAGSNPTVHHWRELIDQCFPFVKMEVIRDPKTRDWKTALRDKGYNTEVAEKSINMIIKAFRVWFESLRIPFRFGL